MILNIAKHKGGKKKVSEICDTILLCLSALYSDVHQRYIFIKMCSTQVSYYTIYQFISCNMATYKNMVEGFI